MDENYNNNKRNRFQKSHYHSPTEFCLSDCPFCGKQISYHEAQATDENFNFEIRCPHCKQFPIIHHDLAESRWEMQ